MDPILIVEDHFATGEAMKRLLQLQGYCVEHVACGQAAIDHLQTELPALVILDIGLGDISGIDVLRHVRGNDRTRGIPVLIFSAFADEEAGPDLLRIGANECWLKSRTDAIHILKRVSNYLPPPSRQLALAS